jgi:hypothetical protein
METRIDPVSATQRQAVTVPALRRADVIAVPRPDAPEQGGARREHGDEHPQRPKEHVPRVGPREIPPNYVFAPGFLHADRRGLIPYPGLGYDPVKRSRDHMLGLDETGAPVAPNDGSDGSSTVDGEGAAA